jgi:hypothetical protein
MINPFLVEPGDVLYDVHRYKTNAGGSKSGEWEVRVISVDEYDVHGIKRRRFTVSWNGNRPQVYSERQIKRLRRSSKKATGKAGGQ